MQALSVVEQQHLDRPDAKPPGAAQRLPMVTLGIVLLHAIVQVGPQHHRFQQCCPGSKRPDVPSCVHSDIDQEAVDLL